MAPQLSGRAQLAFVALPIADLANYDAIIAAILMHYDLNEEAELFSDSSSECGGDPPGFQHTVDGLELSNF